jgi:NAD(P)-dependent dehydrogenase (short-subunit alcohol dehydrogenase family)
MPSDVVVIGAGGIGQAIARRQGAGRTVLLADHSEPVLAAAKEALEADGHAVSARQADVSSRESVRALAQTAAGLGAVVNVVNTAGLFQAPPAAILAVNLVGTALVFEEFRDVIAPGGAGLVISSMVGSAAAQRARGAELRSCLCPLQTGQPRPRPSRGGHPGGARGARELS